MGVFGTAARLCAWARVSPRTVQSGRRKAKGRTGNGKPHLKAALGQMATGAARSDTFLGARYRRLAKRMPKAKASAAIERSILVIILDLLADPTANYHHLGAHFHHQRINKDRQTPYRRHPAPSARPHRHAHPRRLNDTAPSGSSTQPRGRPSRPAHRPVPATGRAGAPSGASPRTPPGGPDRRAQLRVATFRSGCDLAAAAPSQTSAPAGGSGRSARLAIIQVWLRHPAEPGSERRAISWPARSTSWFPRRGR